MVSQAPAREKGSNVTHENDGSITFEGKVSEEERRQAFEHANSGKIPKADRAEQPKAPTKHQQEVQAEHDAAEAAAAAGPVES